MPKHDDAAASMKGLENRIYEYLGVPHELFGEIAKINVTATDLSRIFMPAAHWNFQKGEILGNHGVWGT